MWSHLGKDSPIVELTIMPNPEFLIASPVDKTWGMAHWVYHHSFGWRERQKPWFKPL